MPSKIKTYFRVLVLILLSAFVIRPVVVCAHNADVLARAQQTGKSCSQALSAPHSVFHHVEKEAPDVTTLAACFTKAKAPSLLDGHLNIRYASLASSPQSFIVLRI